MFLGNQGSSVAISGSGSSVAIGGSSDDFVLGAAWIFEEVPTSGPSAAALAHSKTPTLTSSSQTQHATFRVAY